MPFVYDPNLDDDEKENQASQVSISGAAPTVDSGGASGKGGPSSTPNTGSGFQNLDKYLQTNQSQQFGQEVAGKVQNQVNTAKDAMGQAAQSFGQKVESANELPNEGMVNQAIANPTGVDPKQFQKWQSQSYEGPKDLAEDQDNYNKFWSGTAQANTQAKLLGTEPGRFALLDNYFGRPSYGFGQKSLDNLLIQEGGIGTQTKDLQDQAAQLTTQGGAQAKDLQNLASQRAGAIEQSRNTVRGAIGLGDQGEVLRGEKAGAIGREYDSAEKQLADQNAERKRQSDLLETAFGYDNYQNLTPEQIQMTGLGNDTSLYNLNLADYFDQGQDLNINQTMSPEQRARIQALSQLAGVTDSFASGSPSEASSPYSFDTARLAGDQKTVEGQYKNALVQTPVTYKGMDGKPTSRSISELEAAIKKAQTEYTEGVLWGGKKTWDYIQSVQIPALKAAKEAVNEKFASNRKLAPLPTVTSPTPAPRYYG